MADTACYLSTSCFRNLRVEDAIQACRALEVETVEVSAPHPYQPLDELHGIFRKYRAEGVKFSLHNYFPALEKSFVLNPAAADEAGRAQSLELVFNALELAASAESPVYGIHTGYLAKAQASESGYFIFDKEEYLYADAKDRAVAFVNAVAPRFSQNHVRFALENLFPAAKRRHSLFCTFEEIAEIMDEVPESVGLLLDLGHLNVSATLLGFDRMAFIERYLTAFANRLVEVHISENHGLKDEHLPLDPDSWQLDALALVAAAPCAGRIYCLEARAAGNAELVENLGRINEVLNA